MKLSLFTSLFIFLFLFMMADGNGCTRVLWKPGSQEIIVGRTMDWENSTDPEFWIFPRGVSRGGGERLKQTWVSQYGSVVISAYGKVTVDGINEKKLAGHVLYFEDTDYGKHEAGRGGFESALWLQYVLDNYASVKEAVAATKNWNIHLSEVNGYKVTVHLALEDSTGDSAIIQFIAGEPYIYTGDTHTVLTNSNYKEIQQKLTSIDHAAWKNKSYYQQLGITNSFDRFLKAQYFLGQLPLPITERERTGGLMSILRNLSIPLAAHSTIYRTIIDYKSGNYYFDYALNKDTIWINTQNIDFAHLKEAMYLQPTSELYRGEVSPYFVDVKNLPY